MARLRICVKFLVPTYIIITLFRTYYVLPPDEPSVKLSRQTRGPDIEDALPPMLPPDEPSLKLNQQTSNQQTSNQQTSSQKTPSEQTKCPPDLEDALPPGASNTTKTLWSCNHFPSRRSPLDGCAWNHTHISWGRKHNLASVPDPAFVKDPDGGKGGENKKGKKVLRVFYPNGSYVAYPNQTHHKRDTRGGTQFYSYGFEPTTEAYLQYDVFFDASFDFVRGGKLPGLFGGKGHCSGGRNDHCFSMRLHWREYGDVEIYAYMPAMGSVCSSEKDCFFCRCDKTQCNFIHGHSLGRGSFRFVTNKWYTISLYLKLNDLDKTNAEMRLLINNDVVYRITGLRLRDRESVKIDRLFFATFFGGSFASYASTRDTYTYFRNFKVFH